MSTVFYRGMVIDIINSVSGLTTRNKSIEDYQKLINTPNLKSFPRNTIVVKQISEGASKISNNEIICYPFFSSHFSMPLKPGECVWFVFENPDNQGPIAFWLSRVTEPGHVEDLNFTHFPRSYRQSPVEAELGTAARSDGAPARSDITQTYSGPSPTTDQNEQVETIAFAEKVHRFQHVPRYNKRPGDLVLQGSNNSLIMLGEERGHYAESPSDIQFSANKTDIAPGSAAIDIVVGRGNSAATSGTTITNELKLIEVDKRKNPPTEGDPHFPTDSSRLYLTANSNDINSPFHPDKLLNITIPSTDGQKITILEVKAGSFFVGKADNLRLVAKNSGDIRIIKEPTPGSADGAAIILHSTGSLHAYGNNITLSSYHTDGPTEPYVRYSGLVTLLKELIDEYTSIASDISVFCKSFSIAVKLMPSLTTAPGGGPLTNAASVSVPLDVAANTLQSKADAMIGKATAKKELIDKDTPYDIQSSVIFGE